MRAFPLAHPHERAGTTDRSHGRLRREKAVAVIEHAWDIGELLFGFWRFLLSRAYRTRKLGEWREACRSVGGTLLAAAEILGMLVFGVGVPLLVVAFVVVNA